MTGPRATGETFASLVKGQEFAPVEFQLSADWVDAYIGAVDDGSIRALGSDRVPPMALAALAVKALIQDTRLPPGAIHLGQELSFPVPVEIGETLTVRARIANRGERQGWALLGIEMTVERADAQPVMSGRATLTFPLGEGVEG